jgi:hypothetical protein
MQLWYPREERGGACIWAFWFSLETSVLERSESETTNLVKAPEAPTL